MDYWATAMPVTAHAQDPPQPKGVGFYRVKENGKGVLLLCQEALPLTRCCLQALSNLLDTARPVWVWACSFHRPPGKKPDTCVLTIGSTSV